MMTALDVLALAAFEPELGALRAAIALGAESEVASIATGAVGIGLVSAVLGTRAAVESHRPRAVLLLGTCGAYPGALLRVGDVVVAQRIRLVEPWAVTGAAEFAAPIATAIDPDLALVRGLHDAGARPGDVATTLAITVDDAAAAVLERGVPAQVEHLEAFGVAAACEGVPFAAVLGVANIVGSRARDEWRANHRLAADAAAECVLGWLRAGARGLMARGEGGPTVVGA